MKDETKEILDRLKDDSQMCSNSYYRIFKDERDILKDYITNLQEENERLIKLKERYQLEKEVYKSRIAKALEYMDNNPVGSYIELKYILCGEKNEKNI